MTKHRAVWHIYWWQQYLFVLFAYVLIAATWSFKKVLARDHPSQKYEVTSASSRMDKHADGLPNSDDRTRFRLFSASLREARLRIRYKKFQSLCYNFLERPCGSLSFSYHIAIFCLVILGLVLAVLLTVNETDDDLNLAIFILEMFLLIIFTLEYILRMWSAGCRSTYVGFFGRLRFAFKPFVILDLIIIASTFAVILASGKTDLSSSIRILRFFQVLRMVRFDRQGGSWKLLGSVLYLHRQELLTTFYIGFCSLIFASFFVYLAEKGVNRKQFSNLADSFWWGVATLTTVGYGDKVPHTWAGRGVATFFAIMGISFFALPAGILGSGFALKVSQQQRQKHAKRRRRPAAMLIQCNWRYYASRKDSKLVATWLPYIRYLQERNSPKEEGKDLSSNSEKPAHTAGSRRKLSIFGRKQSDGLGKRESSAIIPDYARFRSKKIIENDSYPSIESLQDAHSVSTVDQRTDDEHGKPFLVKVDARKDTSKSGFREETEGQCVDGALNIGKDLRWEWIGSEFNHFSRFGWTLELAKRPYDVKDVIEQYSTGHVELLGKVKGIGHKIDEAFGYKVGTENTDENPTNTRTNVVYRLTKLEKQVKTLDCKLDRVISLLDTTGKKDCPVIETWSEEDNVSSCKTCGKTYTNNSDSEKRFTFPQVKSETANVGPASRTRKLAVHDSYPRLDELRDTLYKHHEPEDGVVNVLLTTQDLNHAVNVGEDKHFDNNGPKSTLNGGPEHQSFDENLLSPKPFGCESYDLRSRSDSAISSVTFDHKKPYDRNSLVISPVSSYSEYENHDMGGSSDTPLYVKGNSTQETRM